MGKMTIEGSLDLFRLPEILQIIAQQRKTGILTVQGQEDIIAISFLEGDVVAADSLHRTLEEGLGEALEAEGLVAASQFRDVVHRHHEGEGTLAEILIKDERISGEAYLGVYRKLIRETLGRLLAWDQGDFKFYSGEEVSYEEGIQPISVEEVLLHGFDDDSAGSGELSFGAWDDRYRTLAPTRPLRVRGVDGPDTSDLDEDAYIWLTRLEKAVLDRVAPSRDAQTIASELGVAGTEVEQILVALESRKLIEVIADIAFREPIPDLPEFDVPVVRLPSLAVEEEQRSAKEVTEALFDPLDRADPLDPMGPISPTGPIDSSPQVSLPSLDDRLGPTPFGESLLEPAPVEMLSGLGESDDVLAADWEEGPLPPSRSEDAASDSDSLGTAAPIGAEPLGKGQGGSAPRQQAESTGLSLESFSLDPRTASGGPDSVDVALAEIDRQLEGHRRSRFQMDWGRLDPWLARILAVGLVIAAAMSWSHDPIQALLAFDLEGEQSRGIRQLRLESQNLRLDRGLMGFYLVHQEFPRHLGRLSDLHLVDEVDLVDRTGLPVGYEPFPVEYVLRFAPEVGADRNLGERTEARSLVGNIFLDPERGLIGDTSSPPLELLDGY